MADLFKWKDNKDNRDMLVVNKLQVCFLVRKNWDFETTFQLA